MPSPFGDAPKAASLLDIHRVLAPNAGVRVSPLCLGAMNFGDAWEEMMGKCDKKTVFELLDFFHEHVEISSTLQTITRMKNLSRGSESG